MVYDYFDRGRHVGVPGPSGPAWRSGRMCATSKELQLQSSNHFGGPRPRPLMPERLPELNVVRNIANRRARYEGALLRVLGSYREQGFRGGLSRPAGPREKVRYVVRAKLPEVFVVADAYRVISGNLVEGQQAGPQKGDGPGRLERIARYASKRC